MKKKLYVYIDPINIKFPGFSIIANRMVRYIPNCEIIDNLSKCNKSDWILPMGIVAGLNLLKEGGHCNTIFLVDALTLGFKSTIKFSWKYSSIFKKSCIFDVLRLIKYIPIERKIVEKYKKIIVVSSHDQKYLERKSKKANFYTVTNGVVLPSEDCIKEKQFGYTLGILHYWGCGALIEIDWFVKSYLPKLRLKYPQLKVIAAGRGADNTVKEYFDRNRIIFLGEVENLCDFFNSIDIYITTVRKECGILNKVLDAFAYKKIVLGLEHNMYPFSSIKDAYLTYHNYQECEDAIKYIANNSQEIRQKTLIAYRYVQEQHNWEKNIKLLEQIINNDYE